MPLYEFRCDNCGEVSEALCKMGSTGKGLKCPGCGGSKLARIMSGFACRSGKGRESAGASASKSACSTCSATSCQTCKL